MVTGSGSGKEFDHSACNSWYLKAWKESLKHPQKPRRRRTIAVPEDDHDGKRARERIMRIRLAREKYHFDLDGITTDYDTSEKLVYDEDFGYRDLGLGSTILNLRASLGKYLNMPPLAEKKTSAAATEEALVPLSLGQSEEMESKYEGDACMINNPLGDIAITELVEALEKIPLKEDNEQHIG